MQRKLSFRIAKMPLVSALVVAVALTTALPGLACASTVTSTATQSGSGTPADPYKTTVTITVVPDSGETIKDFHLWSTATNTKLAQGTTFPTYPDKWSSPSGNGSKDSSKTWKVNNPGSSEGVLPPTGGTFTLVIPGALNSQAWSTFSWVTTSDGSSSTTPPKAGKPGYVAGGTTTSGAGNGGQVPVSMLVLSGPSTIAIGTTAAYIADAAVSSNVSFSYTIRASLSLDPQNAQAVNLTDPLPDSWGVEISTNSQSGTMHVTDGVWQSTYIGNASNRVIIVVPNSSSLVGRTFYLQVEFGNGDIPSPIQVTILGG